MDFRDKLKTVADDASDLADLAANTDVDGICLTTLDQAIVVLRQARSTVIAQLRVNNTWEAISKDTGVAVGTLRRRHDYSLPLTT